MTSGWDIVRGCPALVGPLLAWAILTVPVSAAGGWTTSGVLHQDETWRGAVRLTGDVVVPPGITLALEPGTTVAVTPQQSDHDVSVRRVVRGRERELAHPGLINLIIEGRLRAEGSWWWWRRIRLGSASEEVVGWGGVLFVGNSTTSHLRYTTIHHAHTAVRCLDQAAPAISQSVLKVNVNGLDVYQESAPRMVDSSIRANFRGVGIFDRATPQLLGNIVRGNNQGLLIAGMAKPTVAHNTLSTNTTGVLITEQAQPFLQQNHIGKKWPGLLFRGNRRGVVIADRAAPRVQANVIRGNTSGIILRGQTTPTLDANIVTNNQTDVVDLRQGTP